MECGAIKGIIRSFQVPVLCTILWTKPPNAKQKMKRGLASRGRGRGLSSKSWGVGVGGGVCFFTLSFHPFFPLLHDNGVNWQEAKHVYYTVTVMYWSLLTTRSLDPVIHTGTRDWYLIPTYTVHVLPFLFQFEVKLVINLIKFQNFYYCIRKLACSKTDSTFHYLIPAIAGGVW